MKHLQFKIALVAMLLSFAPKQASAYDFEVDGIYYNVVSMSDLTCEVTHGNTLCFYSGRITIPKQVTYSKRTFNVTRIGDRAFRDCSDLTSVTIPNSVIEIGEDAFWYCSGLTSLTIPNNVTRIGEGAFLNCSGLTSFTIPNTVTVVESDAFRMCANLKTLIIEDGSSTLKLGSTSYNYGYSGLFSDCPLSSVYLGRNIRYENYRYPAFKGKKELTNLTIGISVTSIENSDFSDCSALESITSLATTAPSASESTFSTAAYLNAMLYVPIGSLDSYKSATCWKNFLMEEKDVSGVDGVKADDNLVEKARYSLDGKMLLAPEKGVNIVKMSDGTTKKIVVK